MPRGTFVCGLLVGILAVILTGCPSSPGESGGNTKTNNGGQPAAKGNPKIVRIVSSLPRTGSAKGQTDTMVNGIRMAIDEAGGEVLGLKIEYLDLDDATAGAGQWTPDQETANADKASADPDVMVYIGTYNSGAAKISMPILNKAGILMVSPANTWPGLTKPGIGDPGEPEIYFPSGKRNYVRVVPADDLQGSLAADWAKEMGVKKIFIIDDSEVYGKGLADMFEARCQEIELEVLGRQTIDKSSQEFKTLMTTIKAKKPDLIYFGGTTQTKGGQIAKDMASVGLDAKMMAPDGCFESAFIESAGADVLEGRVFITFGGLPADQLKGDGAKFVENYRAKYSAEPEGYAVYGYEAGKLAIDAIRRAGKKDRAAIVDAAFGTKNFEGALGRWSLDENGDTTLKTISGNTVENGKFKFVKILGGE